MEESRRQTSTPDRRIAQRHTNEVRRKEKLERLANDKGATPGEELRTLALEKMNGKGTLPVSDGYKALIVEGKKALADQEDAQWQIAAIASRS